MGEVKYTGETVKRIVQAMENGDPLVSAALRACVPEETVLEWRNTVPEFAEAIARAEAEYKSARIQSITESRNSKGEHDWRASAWLLEHRFREEFGSAAKTVEPKATPAKSSALSESTRQSIIARRKAALSTDPSTQSTPST